MIKKGIVFSILTAIISGCSIFINALFVSNADPLLFVFLRNIFVAGVLTGVLLLSGKLHDIRSLTRKEWGKLIAIGVIGGGIPFALFFTGLAQVGAINGNIIQKTLFLWVALFGVPILHEKLSKIQIIGYIGIFLGMFVLGGTIRVLWSPGTWLILGATILWGIEHVIAKITLRTISPTVVSWGRMLFGLPLLAVIVTASGRLEAAPLVPVIPIIVSSVLLTGYMLSWYSAISKAPVTLVSSILVIAPVITAILGHKQLHSNTLIIAIGIVMIMLPYLKPRKHASLV